MCCEKEYQQKVKEEQGAGTGIVKPEDIATISAFLRGVVDSGKPGDSSLQFEKF